MSLSLSPPSREPNCHESILGAYDCSFTQTTSTGNCGKPLTAWGLMRECAGSSKHGPISARLLTSTRLKTWSEVLPHGGDWRRARSEPRGSVSGADAAASAACGSTSRTQRARSRICAWPCVTDREGGGAADDDGGGFKTTLQEGTVANLGDTCRGRYPVHARHVALASAELDPSHLSISPVRQEPETTSAWRQRWSPPSKSSLLIH